MFLVVMMMVLVLMIVAAATMFLVVVMMVLVLMTVMTFGIFLFLLQVFQFQCQGCLSIHSLQQLHAGQFIPRCCNDRSLCIVLTQHRHRQIQFLLRNHIRTGKNDRRSRFNLIIIKFAKILHVDLYFARIYYRHGKAQSHFIIRNFFNRTNDIRQLANTGRFNYNSIRSVLFNYLGKSLTKVTHQTTANAARVHLSDLNTGILKEATINTDLTKFIFNQDKFLPCICLSDHLLDQGRLASAQKAGIYIDFRHIHTSFV